LQGRGFAKKKKEEPGRGGQPWTVNWDNTPEPNEINKGRKEQKRKFEGQRKGTVKNVWGKIRCMAVHWGGPESVVR